MKLGTHRALHHARGAAQEIIVPSFFRSATNTRKAVLFQRTSTTPRSSGRDITRTTTSTTSPSGMYSVRRSPSFRSMANIFPFSRNCIPARIVSRAADPISLQKGAKAWPSTGHSHDCVNQLYRVSGKLKCPRVELGFDTDEIRINAQNPPHPHLRPALRFCIAAGAKPARPSGPANECFRSPLLYYGTGEDSASPGRNEPRPVIPESERSHPRQC